MVTRFRVEEVLEYLGLEDSSLLEDTMERSLRRLLGEIESR